MGRHGGQAAAAGGRDRLHNFNRAAEMLRTTREKALVGMWAKHVVSILDIVDDFPKVVPSIEMIDEKLGDLINYSILLEANLKEDIARINSEKKILTMSANLAKNIKKN